MTIIFPILNFRNLVIITKNVRICENKSYSETISFSVLSFVDYNIAYFMKCVIWILTTILYADETGTKNLKQAMSSVLIFVAFKDFEAHNWCVSSLVVRSLHLRPILNLKKMLSVKLNFRNNLAWISLRYDVGRVFKEGGKFRYNNTNFGLV